MDLARRPLDGPVAKGGPLVEGVQVIFCAEMRSNSIMSGTIRTEILPIGWIPPRIFPPNDPYDVPILDYDVVILQVSVAEFDLVLVGAKIGKHLLADEELSTEEGSLSPGV